MFISDAAYGMWGIVAMQAAGIALAIINRSSQASHEAKMDAGVSEIKQTNQAIVEHTNGIVSKLQEAVAQGQQDKMHTADLVEKDKQIAALTKKAGEPNG